ncbi:MAG: GGDEF domain-containing protein [Spirochaetaceae bacterium]|jgi:diguanylate cyclase (GGDEF)-like protein|nr:GGDEF domain-containing protein [Spirochaetaceae bacterium]
MGAVPAQNVFDLSLIEKADLFTSLMEDERKFVVSRSGILQLRRGERLFSAGERANHFYQILEGRVRVYKPLPGDGVDEIALFNPGDTIGEFDFIRQAAYNAYAEVVEDAILIIFPGPGLTLEDINLEAPRAVSQMLLGSIVMMTSRIKATQKIVVENIAWVQELNRRAYEDPGTGLLKQTFLSDEGHNILEAPVALFMLKPDRFKILVDSRGHQVGDEVMIRIAKVLKNCARRNAPGWALRFKSNEIGVLLNKCDSDRVEQIARSLTEGIAALESVPPEQDQPAFHFSATCAYALWPRDDPEWDSLLQGVYGLLLEAWRAGGNRIVQYKKPEEQK